MSEQEKYIPTPEDYHIAEEIMTEEQKRESDERVAAFAESKPNQLNKKIGTLLHPIDERLLHLNDLDPVATKSGFVRKPEFHMTVIGNRSGKEVRASLWKFEYPDQQRLIQKINDAARATDWSINPGELRKIVKDYVVQDDDGNEKSRERRETIIQLLDVPGMKQFYAALNELLGTNLEAPPAHITLYSTSSDPKNVTRGIGIESQAELEQLHPQPVNY